MQDDYLSLFKEVLLSLGYSNEASNQALTDLTKRMNLAIAEEIFTALTPQEQKDLATSLEEVVPAADTEKMSAVLTAACENSVNHPDSAKLVNQARFKVTSEFWQEKLDQATDDQKQAAADALEKIVTDHPEISQATSYFQNSPT